MDIAGAKALKRRLGGNEASEALHVSVDVPEDALPVYHWVRVGRVTPDTAPTHACEERQARITSLMRRLGLAFR